ncbi:MGMT family protein [Pseudalkalibacillus berkeleyi]|uniref:MGMT family protein n=1 Tax=Pseudalkalibacillus berkeleyi TaxID=1069813 RepID=A0ABS9GXD8_9BACL|nr:MGMT family protein [Pseudalkalibacillus berkeleyi]MCF6137443.1 MGMT family protein [Pseudalkalibacillus berkeleyi]
MKPFTENVVKIISSIPAGRVMTYGQIAKLAGSPRGARQVVRVLHTMSQAHQLPWHRVINSKGAISIKDDQQNDIQRKLLQKEGIIVDTSNTIDLNTYQHHPNEIDDDVNLI